MLVLAPLKIASIRTIKSIFQECDYKVGMGDYFLASQRSETIVTESAGMISC